MSNKNNFRIVRDTYDKIAEHYYKDRDLFKHNVELDQFSARLSKGDSVLDIGCGGGIPVTRYLIDKGFNLTGIDFSTGMLAIAKRTCPEARLIKMNMAELAFDNNSFNGVVAFYSIIHFPRNLHSALFKDIRRILRPGGVMLICLGSDDWEAVDEYYDEKMYWSHFGSEESLVIVKQAGFEILSEEVKIINDERHYWIVGRAK